MLPIDIISRVNNLFPDVTVRKEVFAMLETVKPNSLNVGRDQFIRSILIIGGADKEKIKQALDLLKDWDPRDIIMEAMGVEGNTNYYGNDPFED